MVQKVLYSRQQKLLELWLPSKLHPARVCVICVKFELTESLLPTPSPFLITNRKTSELIPLCHPLPLDKVQIDIKLIDNKTIALITCECRVTHKTGVEMEALTGATVTALTIYDMVKAVSHNVTITDTKLVSKSGGKRCANNE